MALSLFDASIPIYLQMMRNLSAILDKAEAHAKKGLCSKCDKKRKKGYKLCGEHLATVQAAQKRGLATIKKRGFHNHPAKHMNGANGANGASKHEGAPAN